MSSPTKQNKRPAVVNEPNFKRQKTTSTDNVILLFSCFSLFLSLPFNQFFFSSCFLYIIFIIQATLKTESPSSPLPSAEEDFTLTSPTNCPNQRCGEKIIGKIFSTKSGEYDCIIRYLQSVVIQGQRFECQVKEEGLLMSKVIIIYIINNTKVPMYNSCVWSFCCLLQPSCLFLFQYSILALTHICPVCWYVYCRLTSTVIQKIAALNSVRNSKKN